MATKKALDVAEKSMIKTSNKPTGEDYLAENLAMLTKIGFETSQTIDLLATKMERAQKNENILIANTVTLRELTQAVREASDNINYLMQKLGSVASHVIAMEAVLADIAPKANIDMPSLVAKIRKDIDAATDGKGDAAKAIDVATRLISKK
jgi:hypothetical protein